MKMHVDIHDVTHATCRQLGASINLTFSGTDGEITLYLPEKMLACATMIVGAFNAHMSGETVAEGVERVTLQYNPAEHWPNKPLTIEAGKYYRARGGHKVGPMKLINQDFDWPWAGQFDGESGYSSFRGDGRWSPNGESSGDLIAEWPGTPSESDERASAERG